MRELKWALAVLIVIILAIPSATMASGSDPEVTRSPPTLSHGGVTPSSGYSTNTTFRFFVNYSHSSNIRPAYVNVVIDGKNHGMNTPTGNYTTGINCTYSYSRLNPGTHKYYFVASHAGYNNTTVARFPESSYYQLQVKGNEYYPELYNDSAYPYNPDINETVTFWVNYKDPNGNAPKYVNLKIDDGTILNMTTTGTDYRNGTSFHVNHTFTSPGPYSFHFEAVDAYGLTDVTRNRSIWITTPTKIWSGGVNPSSGDARNTTFTFWANYSPPHNSPFYYTRVIVDDRESYKMERKSLIDNSTFIYRYEYSGSFFSGRHRYHFTSNDHYTNSSRYPRSGYLYFNATGNFNPPELFNASITPEWGNSSTVFNMSVYYKDPNGDKPEYVQLRIQSLEGDASWDMKALWMNVSGSDYRNGVLCHMEMKLPEGEYQIHFRAFDTQGLNFTYGYFRRTVYDGSPGKLINGSVYPEEGIKNTAFNFKVEYQGRMWPGLVILRIEDWYQWPCDTDRKDNKTVIFRYNWSDYHGNNSKTEYEFFFEGNDSFGNYIRYPEEGKMSFHVYDHFPELYDGGRSPKNGNDTTEFKFWVGYRDEENTAPSEVKILLDNGSYDMSHTATTYETGINCSYTTKLSPGKHNYHFMARLSDGAWVRYPEEGDLSLDVTGHTSLESRQVIPTTGDANTLFNFTIKYRDTEGLSPDYVRLFVDNDYYNMTVEGSDHTKGITCYYETRLTEGNHTYYFETKNNRGVNRLPSPGKYFVIHVSRPDSEYTPELLSAQVTPSSGNRSTTFTFAVVYRDRDGDAFRYMKIFIDGTGYNMSTEGMNYKAGVNCSYSTKLSAGTHSYYYSSIDETNRSVRYPASSSLALIVASDPGSGGGGGGENEPPVARIEYSVIKRNVTLDGSSSSDPDGQIVTYYWTVDGKIHTGKYVNVTFDKQGYYRVTLKVVDDDGLSDTDLVDFWVYDRKKSDNTSHSVGGKISVDDTGAGTAESYDDKTSVRINSTTNKKATFDLSTTEDDKIVIMEVSKDLIGADSESTPVIDVDGRKINVTDDLEGLLTGSFDEPVCYVEDIGGSYRVFLYMPEKSDSEVEVYASEEESKDEDVGFNMWLLLALLVMILLVVMVAAFIWTRAKRGSQYTEMMEELDELEDELEEMEE